MSASNYLENALVNGVLRNTAYTPSTQIYLALYTADPTESSTGPEIAFSSSMGYSRTAINFTTPTDGVTSNSTITITATPTESWGTISHFSLMETSTGVNMLYYGALSTPRVVGSGNAVTFAAGALTITLA